jgi:Protein of unknown function (DUF3551)
MKKILRGLLLPVAAGAALWLGTSPSHAGLYGNGRWCAVTDSGAGEATWECEFDTQEECAPAVTGGNRGFCALNPYWRQDQN